MLPRLLLVAALTVTLAAGAPAGPATARTASTAPVAAAEDERLGNGCRLGPRGVPECGALLGAAHGSNSDPSQLERELGTRLGLRRTYWRADQVGEAVAVARTDLEAGRLPWLSFKLPTSWQAMTSSWGEVWARGLARRLARLPGPVWVAFHHEPELDGDVLAWRRMQERFLPAVRAEAPRVAYTVVLTGWHQFYGPDELRLSRVFPDGPVDVAGFDIYNKYGVVQDGRPNTDGTDLDADYFARIEEWAARRGVAWGLAETGYSDRAVSRYPDWIQQTYRALEQRGGVAYAYFDTTLNSVADWDLSDPAKRRDFEQALAASPRFPEW